MVPSCGLTVYFLPSFFLFLIKVKEKKIPEEENQQKQQNKIWKVDVLCGRTFEFRIYLKV